MDEQIKNNISAAKNICLIPSENEPESIACALALFYTLKELGKNVNLTLERFPDRLHFLVPSVDFISSPKNFVISLPRAIADISQIYYEKNDEHLKIHLTLDKGLIKKDDISFYASEAKPDLLITLGVKNFQKELSSRLDSFGYILDTPILNIDNSHDQQNLLFGTINVVQEKSITETTLELLELLDANSIKKEVANCLLAGLVIRYEDFKKGAHPEIFKLVSSLMEKGADYHQVTHELSRTSEHEVNFLTKIFQALRPEPNGVMVSELTSDDFQEFSEVEAHFAVNKIKSFGIEKDILVLWKSHGSDPMTKGFFYSKKPHLIEKISGQNKQVQKDWVFLSLFEGNTALAKGHVIELLA